MSQIPYRPKCFLDGQPVDKITAFLFPKGGNDDPHKLKANEGKSFQGIVVLGMGFTFDDTDKKEEATPIAEMERLIAKNPHYQEVIVPYIGGSEVNSSPTHAHHRYIIDWGQIPEEEAREKYPDLMKIVEEKVKPKRLKQASIVNPKKWWMFARSGADLRKAIAPLSRVLVIPCGATSNVAFSFLDSRMVFANTLAVLTFENYTDFAILQSKIHEVWTRFFGSSMKDDLRYTPSDCFETFPFPEDWEDNSELEAIGQEYYEYRAELMVKNNQGLTETYNRFHNPNERDPAINKLQELHQKMDEAVLKAYGWEDLELKCGFSLDYFDLNPEDVPPEIQDRIDSNNFYFAIDHEASVFESYVKTERKSLPWRYRWNQELHDEILGRLLDLNAQRHEQEMIMGSKGSGGVGKKGAKRQQSKEVEGQQSLF